MIMRCSLLFVRNKCCYKRVQPQAIVAFTNTTATTTGATRFASSGTVNTNNTAPPSGQVENEEVSKFSNMSSSWWDTRENPLVGMNPVRIQFILEHAKQLQVSSDDNDNHSNTSGNKQGNNVTRPTPRAGRPLHGLSFLDIGCGGGILSESLARLGANTTALDPSSNLIQVARRRNQEQNLGINYISDMTIQEFAQQEQCHFDAVCVMEVLEHVDDVQDFLQTASQLVNPRGGLLFISSINQTFLSYCLGVVGAEYVMGYLPRGTHDWHAFVSPETVSQHLIRPEQNDHWKVRRVMGMVPTSVPLPFCSSSRWEWQTMDDHLAVNWIGAYQRQHNEK